LITPAVTIGFRALLDETDVAKKLDRLGAFRVLCAHRRGDFGVDALNQLIEEALADAGLIRPDTDFYSGRPILVTQSDYQLELYNGDVGVLAESEGRLKAWFFGPKGELRSFSPARLPPHETVFAMTVHKSQGSEFERAFLILPPGPSPIVTRELVYTGLTRARQRIEIVATERVLSLAIAQRIERASGLSDALWSA
jgi:exodeoxyribonuclease V alpha subunit